MRTVCTYLESSRVAWTTGSAFSDVMHMLCCFYWLRLAEAGESAAFANSLQPRGFIGKQKQLLQGMEFELLYDDWLLHNNNLLERHLSRV